MRESATKRTVVLFFIWKDEERGVIPENCFICAICLERPVMPGPQPVTRDPDARRRRIIFRAWHRGIREMDLIFGQYADACVAGLDDSQLDELEYIMSFEDRDLLSWITGEVETPAAVSTPVFHDILAYRSKMDFV